MSLFKDVNYLMNFYILIPSNIMHLNFYIHSITNIHISRIVISNAKSPVVVFLTPKYISFYIIVYIPYIAGIVPVSKTYLMYSQKRASYQYQKHTMM